MRNNRECDSGSSCASAPRPTPRPLPWPPPSWRPWRPSPTRSALEDAPASTPGKTHSPSTRMPWFPGTCPSSITIPPTTPRAAPSSSVRSSRVSAASLTMATAAHARSSTFVRWRQLSARSRAAIAHAQMIENKFAMTRRSP